MFLSDQETTVLDIIAQYNLLTECQEKGHLSKEKYDQIILSFGSKNLEMVNYYTERLNEYFKDTADPSSASRPAKAVRRVWEKLRGNDG